MTLTCTVSDRRHAEQRQREEYVLVDRRKLERRRALCSDTCFCRQSRDQETYRHYKSASAPPLTALSEGGFGPDDPSIVTGSERAPISEEAS